ncbi:hypothetical protein BKA67DRAFT_49708 [Truncatella angustata]|uniref:Uncharacterized protein n=1 Tax=Truncatella angustata TaxID=152316 RepID=A0A9P8UXV1_9PEZI|nr:uncharacterized protein BKA67DRAFT_49708 [Truncatella angustata]KAH6660373.1 hypothetical protein BKA67DRAFT_49708 [Truncatella angustata]
MDASSCHVPLFHEGESATTGSIRKIAQLTEVIPVMTCIIINTSYVIKTESHSPVFFVHLGALTNPSPALMLGSCVLLGCLLSSFTHRRRGKDRFQTIVFGYMVLWGITVGKGIGASVNLIALSLVPGALCAAMLLSFSAHEFVRWLMDRPLQQELIYPYPTKTF